ncbi:MAG: PrsW family glutamic-type intramembrane protease [Lachnospiraceae bacterium]
MIYAENILVLLVAPFVVGFFLLKGESRRFVGFFSVGALICLLASCMNSFVAGICGMSSTEAIIKITPVIEEVMKVLPLLFYMIVFLPKKDDIFKSSVALGIGFATYENCCYVISMGADDFYFILIRGFAVGIMHILCAVALGFALGFSDRQTHFAWLGVFASVSACIAYHSIYNLMVSGNATWQIYGFFMPFATVVMILVVKNIMLTIKQAN